MPSAPGDHRVAADGPSPATGPVDHPFGVLAMPSGPSRRHVCDALTERGIRVAAVGALHEIRRALDRLRPDVVIVDVAVAAHRHEVCALVRAADVPLIVTSVSSPSSRVELLLAGADDCLPAPFAPEELTARIVAIVRRACGDTPPEPALIRAGPIRIDVRSRRVRRLDVDIFLTAKEFDLLTCLARHRGETLSRDRLLAEVWGYAIGDASTVTVHVRRLRSKVEADPGNPGLIQTVWGIGYRFGA